MKNIIAISIIASSLFITGWYLLFSIRYNQAPSKPYKIVDYGPYCDESNYPSFHYSEADIVIEQKDDEKFVGPQEHFLVINEGETLHSILRPHEVSQQEIANLGLAFKPFIRVRDLAAGDLYRFNLQSVDGKANIIDNFVISKLDSNRVPIIYRAKRVADAQFVIETTTPAIKEELAVVELTVDGTLYQTFNQIPFGNELMQRFMGVFFWQMRMPQDVTSGDLIKIVATKKYVQDTFIGFGNIETVTYRQNNKNRFAIYFVAKDQSIRGFFDENGRSLEKEFAYSPVQETTATSNQKWRMHPILKTRIRHNGIDYRGPIGTKIYSIADGEIIEKRFDRNVGNMLRIRHKYGIHSEYFHADTLVEKLKVGSRVKRGQLIGTIGRTGRLCTGPHLHMGLYKMQGHQRKYIELSSLRNILKKAPDLPARYLVEFRQRKEAMAAIVQKDSVTVSR